MLQGLALRMVLKLRKVKCRFPLLQKAFAASHKTTNNLQIRQRFVAKLSKERGYNIGSPLDEKTRSLSEECSGLELLT